MGDFPTPDRLRAIDDPRERARVAGQLAAAGKEAATVRDEAIVELLEQPEGLRPFEIAALASVSSPYIVKVGRRTRAATTA